MFILSEGIVCLPVRSLSSAFTSWQIYLYLLSYFFVFSKSLVSFLITKCRYSIFSLFFDTAFDIVILTLFVLSANFSDEILYSFVPS